VLTDEELVDPPLLDDGPYAPGWLCGSGSLRRSRSCSPNGETDAAAARRRFTIRRPGGSSAPWGFRSSKSCPIESERDALALCRRSAPGRWRIALKFCVECGEALSSAQKFCGSCGTQSGAATAPSPDDRASAPQAIPPTASATTNGSGNVPASPPVTAPVATL